MEDTQDIPKVIQNSDYLYKSDIKWRTDIEYIEPNQFEKDMLKDTKTPSELLKEEAEEEKIVLKTPEEKEKEKIKNLITIFKVITSNRMGLHPLHNLSYLQPSELERYKNNMNSLAEDFNNGMGEEITNEFNRICNDKLFSCGADVSVYPVYGGIITP
jgi:hypothetical protein